MLQGEPTTPDPASTVALGALLAAVGLAVVPFAMAMVRRLQPERRVFFARWGFTHLLLVVLVALFASIAVSIAWPVEDAAEMGVLESFARMGLMYSPVGLAIARFAWKLEPLPAKALGFERHGNLRAVCLGVAAYVLLLPGLLGVTLLWPELLRYLGEAPELQDVLTGFFELSGGELALAFFGAAVVLPFFEELVFRGFLQPLLVQNFRDRGGVVLTG